MATITIAIDADELADAIAARVVALLGAGDRSDRDRQHEQDNGHHDGYLAPIAAARYLGVSRKRVYSLKSSGVLVPDGHDGRTPLWTRATLDAYVRGIRSMDHLNHVDRRNGRRRPNPWTARHAGKRREVVETTRRPLASGMLTQ